MAAGVACDTEPGTVGVNGGRVPGGERRMRVVRDGGFEREKSLGFGKESRERRGKVKMENQKNKKKKPYLFAYNI